MCLVKEYVHGVYTITWGCLCDTDEVVQAIVVWVDKSLVHFIKIGS